MAVVGSQNDPKNYKFVRSPEGVLFGVCRGLADGLGLDVVLLRIIWLVALLWFGTGFLFYVILALTLPRADQLDQANDSKLLGVCARISLRYGVEVGLVRAGFVLFTLLSAVVGGLLIYVVGYFLIPPNKAQAGR